jgi:hypothetical protein
MTTLAPIQQQLRSRLVPVWQQYSSQFRAGNIAMFHMGRCGSTVLGNLLNQHQKVYWDGEIFERHHGHWKSEPKSMYKAGQTPLDILQKRMIIAGSRFYGLEIKPSHLDAGQIMVSDFINQLDTLGFRHFIVLIRRNFLRSLVSNQVMYGVTGQTHQHKSQGAQLHRIVLDPEKVRYCGHSQSLLEHLHDHVYHCKVLDVLLESRHYLKLYYEDMLMDDPRVGYERLCRFIKVAPQPCEVKLSRTNPFSLQDQLLNFDQVQTYLKGTDFEWMLYA